MKNTKTTRKAASRKVKTHVKRHLAVRAPIRHVKVRVKSLKRHTAKIHVAPKKVAVVKVPKLTKKEQLDIHNKEVADAALGKTREVVSETFFCEYITKAVGSHANNIIGKLLDGPKVDEKLSEILNIKLNETRRVLNVLNSYGIVRYNINKDSNGWLTFLWYIDHNSVGTFREHIMQSTTAKSSLPEGCNDFFACPSCSKKQRMVLPFEIAFDNSFKCSCGKALKSVSREEAEGIYNAVLA